MPGDERDVSPAPASDQIARELPARNGAEALVHLLAAHGIELLFLNPGTDTAPIQEAIVALGREGYDVPTIVPCLYENVALAAAHGYFCVTRRPQAVLVHVDSGTLNLGANLHNAQRAHAGVVILAGRTPDTIDGTAAGGRDRASQWLQHQLDQAGIVRGYVKWSHDLGRADTLNLLLPRAVQIAASEPAGPVYLTVARETLMEPLGRVTIEPPRRSGPAIVGPGDPRGLETIADWLADAELPLAIAGDVGRHPAAVGRLAALADLLGMLVSDKSGPLNMPASHLLYRQDVSRVIPSADVLLLLDTPAPWAPATAMPAATARIAQIDVDPVKASMPMWGFPVDLPLAGDTAKALPLLVAAVERRATPERLVRWRARRERLTAETAARRGQVAERLAAERGARPLSVEAAMAALGEALPPDAIVLEEAITNQSAVRRQMRREVPGTVLHPIGSGLGWALGAAVGVRLAAPDRVIAAVVGDGSFIFGSPIAALYAAIRARAPFLTAILNNGGYAAARQPLELLFPDGASIQSDTLPAVRFEEPPDYAALARSCRAHGERVEDPAAVGPAIERALAAVAEGRPAVLDMIVTPL